jgi:conjugative transfer signal peptidase TraF
MQETITMILCGLLAPLSAGILIAGLFAIFQFGHVRVNASASLPIGLYRTTSDESARLIEFCPAEPFGSLSASRNYREKGNCPDGAQPLMKPIVAISGDSIEVKPTGVAVNGRLLPNSAARPFDTQNRPLPHWPFGEYRVVPGRVWVISTFNRRSFDSRYFGPIPVSSIRAHLRPLLTE